MGTLLNNNRTIPTNKKSPNETFKTDQSLRIITHTNNTISAVLNIVGYN